MKPRSLHSIAAFRATFFVVSFGLAVASHAADIIKLDNNINLNSGLSWTGGIAPGSGSVAVWDSTVTNANTTVLGGDLSWSGIRIADPGDVVTINVGNTLTLGTAGIDMSGANRDLTLANALSLGASQTWNVTDFHTLTAGGTIGGTGTLTKSGSGTLRLSNANTFNGGATISEGTVIAGNNASFGTGTLTMSGGTITTSGVLNFSNPVFVTADTVTNIYGYDGGNNYPRFSGAITGSGTIQNMPLQGSLGNAFIDGDISGFTGTFNIESGPASGDNFQFSGTLPANREGAQARFLVNGTGSGSFYPIEVAGMTFKMGELAGTGGIISSVQSGTLEIGALNTDSTFSGAINTGAGISLTKVGTGALTLAGSGISYGNATNVNSGTLTLSNTTAWGSAIAMGASNSPILQLNAPLATDAWTFGKVISGSSAGATVAKTGPGTVTITSSQSYAGSTNVNEGTLALSSTSPAQVAGAVLWLDASDATTLFKDAAGTTPVTAAGDVIARWNDKSGNGNNVTIQGAQTGPTYQMGVGLTGQSAARFSATASCGMTTPVSLSSGDCSIFVVYSYRSTTFAGRRVIHGLGSNWLMGPYNNTYQTYNGGFVGGPATVANQLAVHDVAVTAGGALSSYVNGNLAGSRTGTYPGQLVIGSPGSGEPIDGDVVEVLVYNTVLTAAQRQGIEAYLGRKWVSSSYSITSLSSSGSVTVANTATFGGTGTAGNTTVAAGGTVQAGNAGTGSLTLNKLTFSGAGTVSVTPGATSAPLVVTGALTTGGANSVVVSVPNGLAVGTYHAIQYGSLSGSPGDFKFPAPSRFMTLVNNAPYIDVVVSANSAFPIWTGGSSGAWSYAAGSGNWKLSSNSSATDFLAADNPLFDDSAAVGHTAVTLSTDSINCGVITFNNSSRNYTLTQANSKDITSGSLVKTGSGSLTISGGFSYSGGSTLNGGTVSIDDAAGLGTGGRSFNGGTLEYTGGAATIAGASTINSGGATIRVTDPDTILTQGGILSTSGTGSLIKQGSGTFVLPLGSGTYSNALTINGGTLNLNYGANGATLTGNITGSSGILRLDGAGASPTSGLTLTGNNTFIGETDIYGFRIFLDSPSGNAISGNIVVKQGQYPNHGISLLRNEQIADTAELRFDGLSARYDFRLNGKTETLAGIVCDNGNARIANAGSDGGVDTGIAAAGTLIVSGPGIYSYNGNLLDQGGGTNGVLNFTKSGSGSQTLTGTSAQNGIIYTGVTTVNSGVLELKDTTGFASPVTLNGGTLTLNRSSGLWDFTKVIGAGGGNVRITGFGIVNLAAANTYTGTTTVESGTLKVTGSIASPLIDVLVDGTLESMTVGSGKTVQGTGTLTSVAFASGSTLQPGTSATIDIMRGNGTITFAAGSNCVMQVNRASGVITNDKLTNMAAVTYGGTLTVTATGQAFVNNDVINLFPGASIYSGGFSSVNLPTLSAGLSWDLSGLTSDGSIKVVSFTATPVFNPPSGGYAGPQSVTISSTAGATIYYTMNNSTPTASSPNGMSPVSGLSVPTNSTVTIKSFARKAGQADSPVTTSVYTTLDIPVWIVDQDGAWQDTFNWKNGVVGQGAGVTVDFSTLTTSATTSVYLDGPRTVGSLLFADQGNQNGWNITPGAGGSLILNNGANPPAVTVGNQTTTISAPVASGNGLLKKGAGTLVLNDLNSITGPLTISQGALVANKSGALGSSANTMTLGDASTGSGTPELKLDIGINSGVTLGSIANTSQGASQTITLNPGAGLPANQAALTTTLNLNGSVPVTLKATNTAAHSTVQDVNWRIVGNGVASGNTALILDGSTFGLRTSQLGNTTVASNFTGDVLIKGFVTTQGRTYFAGNNASDQNLNFLNNNVTVSSGATWNLVWGGETAGALTGPGNVVLNCQTALNSIGLTLGNNNASGSHTGVISGGFGLSKVGTGAQTLGGANTYSGATTVNAGTLTLANATGSATGSAAVSVKTGGILSGTGSASGATTVEAGGSVTPGTAGAGALTLASATVAGAVELKLNAATCGSLAVTGTLTVSPGATINLSSIVAPTAASYTLVTYATLSGTLPTITGVPSGYTVDTATAGMVKLVQGGSPYTNWINGFASLTNPADKLPTADPDKDGLANILEFVTNSNPTSGSSNNLPTITNSGSNFVFTYTRRDDSESLNPTVEFDTDMAGTWTTAVDPANATIVVTENSTNPDTVTVTIPKGSNSKLFARLKVTQ